MKKKMFLISEVWT